LTETAVRLVLIQPDSTAGHQLTHRGADQHLPRAGFGHDPHGQVHPDPGDLVPVQLHLAAVQSDAELQPQGRHRRHRGRRCSHRWGWGIEPGQEPIACGVHFPAAMSGQHGADDVLVASQQGRPRGIAQLPQASSGADDVGEQRRLD
jgi:hypothetical protein